jgi:hypothetical protein
MTGPVSFPACQQCGRGNLVPLSDFSSHGASVLYKAWVCTSPDCGFNIKIKNGDIIFNEIIHSGSRPQSNPMGPSRRGPA